MRARRTAVHDRSRFFGAEDSDAFGRGPLTLDRGSLLFVVCVVVVTVGHVRPPIVRSRPG